MIMVKLVEVCILGITSRSFLSCSWRRVSMNGACPMLMWWGCLVPRWSPCCPAQSVAFFSILQDMCKIALMYCRLIKERAEALSLSEQNEGKAANRVGIGAGTTAWGEAGFGRSFWAKRDMNC